MKKLYAGLFLSLIFPAAYAATIYYNGVDGIIGVNWKLGTTWVGGVIPSAGDDVVFDSSHATVSSNSTFVWLNNAAGEKTIVNSITFVDNFFDANKRALRFTWGQENPVLEVTQDVVLKTDIKIGTRGYAVVNEVGMYCGGTLDVKGNFICDYSSMAGYIGGTSNATTTYGDFAGPLTNFYVGGNLELKSLAGLNINVGVNTYGSTVDINNPDVDVKGFILAGNTSTERGFLYLGAPSTGNVSQVVACGGLSGFLGIRNAMNGKTGLTTIVLNVAAAQTVYHSYALSDDRNWDFNATSKMAVVMNGEGTQYLGYDNSSQLRFSGGITVNSGKLLVNGNAKGSNDTVYTHGDLEMNGGSFGIFNNQSGAGTFTFTDCYWKDGTIILGTYENTVDMLTFTGTFSVGVGEISDVVFSFEGDCSALLTQQKIIDCSDFSSDFTVDSFKADDAYIFGELYTAEFELKSDGLYMQYVAAVPEPAMFAIIFGFASFAFAFARRRR